MASVVLVHGIGQEQYGPAYLLTEWLPAISDAVSKARGPDCPLVERIWSAQRSSPDPLDIRMAFYAEAFINDGAQGVQRSDVDRVQAAQDGGDFSEQLAHEWLAAAAERAGDPTDRHCAQHARAVMAGPAQDQGGGHLARPVISALAGIRWFAPFGMAAATRFVCSALEQVTRYFEDAEVRSYAQDQVLRLIGDDTVLVIGHSLGSVVAFEALCRTATPVTFITLGSPLGLRTVIYDRLQPAPPVVPACVTAWKNFVGTDDLIAARPDLALHIPAAADRSVSPQLYLVDNGSQPHSAVHYLTKFRLGCAVADALDP